MSAAGDNDREDVDEGSISEADSVTSSAGALARSGSELGFDTG
jgi:hypothetical protein